VDNPQRVFDEPVIAEGNAPDDGFVAWVTPHWPAMAGLARRMAASGQHEDVLQDALSSAWAHRAQFDATRGASRNWLLAIVANCARRSYRRLTVPAAIDSTDLQVADEGGRLDLRRAILGLTDRQRLAVELYYFLDLAIADVAAVMGCSAGTVKSTLADARRRLRECLGEAYR
jgi:RNA polymerase sigma factor (sigma-70 family)